jgi:hypothetical protein
VFAAATNFGGEFGGNAPPVSLRNPCGGHVRLMFLLTSGDYILDVPGLICHNEGNQGLSPCHCSRFILTNMQPGSIWKA